MAQVEMVEMEVEITPPEQMNVDVTVQSMDVDISAETMTGTVIQGIDEIKDKIDNIKLPDIDLSAIAKEATLTQGISSVENKVEEEVDSIEKKIEDIVAAYNNGQEIIDQMVAIQLQTIIGGEE